MAVNPLVLDYSDFVSGDASSLKNDVVVVKSVPVSSNLAFIDVVSKLGVIPELESVAGAPIEDRVVYRIETSGLPTPYEAGSVLASTTAEALPLHTDGVNREDAYDCIALLTVRVSDRGPFTLFMSWSDIKCRLPRVVLDELMLPQWPFRYGYDSIVRSDGSALYFNPQLIERWSSKFPIRQAPAKQALRSLVEVASHVNATELWTESGDCVVARNTRVLHGRRAIPEGSLRVLKRIRFNRR